MQCILRCLEDIIKYFNRWASCYIGIYGDSFCVAGKRVYELFQNRGLSMILTDDLIEMCSPSGA